jgi:hypothetical protein
MLDQPVAIDDGRDCIHAGHRDSLPCCRPGSPDGDVAVS